MKFGKNIGRVVELSDPEWSPFWVNYKFLKKKAKALEVPSEKLKAASPDQRSNPEAIAQSAGEVEFYRLLRQELRKCAEFFTGVEAQLMVRQARVNEGWRQLLLPNIIVEGNPNKRLMAACVKLYKDLLLLENFAIMNYCGFSKILKKHDKLTGFLTRESFMKNVVNQAPFVQYPRVITMLSAVEALFKNIESLPSASAEAGTRVPLREEQLFIDTMLTINTEAFRLQQAEGADIGLNTPEFTHKRDGFSHKAPRLRSATENANANGSAAATAAGSSNNRGGRGGGGGGRGGGGGGGGVGGSNNSSSTGVPHSNGPAGAGGRGLEIVAAAAAQVVSRDSEEGGGSPSPPRAAAAGDAGAGAAPDDAAVAVADAAAAVAAASTAILHSPPGASFSTPAAAEAGGEAEGPVVVVAEGAQTGGARTPSARNGQRERGGDDKTSPPLSKRLRPDSRW